MKLDNIVEKIIEFIKKFEMKYLNKTFLSANIGFLLTFLLKLTVVWRLVRGFLVVIGLIALLTWMGFDFTHVLRFFEQIPEMLNLQDTWLGEMYTALFQAIHEMIDGIVEGVPKPDGEKVIDAFKQVIEDSKQ